MNHKNKQNNKNADNKKRPKSESLVRLNKFIASYGAYSRREVDKLISEGKITVNGNTVRELGARIKPGDAVLISGKKISVKNHTYILINKPKNTLSTIDKATNKKNVFDLIKKVDEVDLTAICQLEYEHTGVMIVSNDPELEIKLTEKNKNKISIYNLSLSKPFDKKDHDRILSAISINKIPVIVSELSYVDENDFTQIGLEIINGSPEVIVNLFRLLGYEIEKLDRVYFAGLTKKGLQRGHWRLLKKTEIASLKMGSYR